MQKDAVTKKGRMTLLRSTRQPRELYSNLSLMVTLRLQPQKQKLRESK